MTLGGFFRNVRAIFLHIDSANILGVILAAILDLQVTCMLDLNSHDWIGSGMVKNIYLDSNIVALTALLA